MPDNLADNLFDAVGMSVTNISEQVNASCIVVFTHHGRKAKVISKFKPSAPIIAVSDNFDTLNFLNLHWGIFPYFMENFSDEDNAIKATTNIIKDKLLAKEGDVVMFTSGAPYTEKGRKSWLKFVVV